MSGCQSGMCQGARVECAWVPEWNASGCQRGECQAFVVSRLRLGELSRRGVVLCRVINYPTITSSTATATTATITTAVAAAAAIYAANAAIFKFAAAFDDGVKLLLLLLLC